MTDVYLQFDPMYMENTKWTKAVVRILFYTIYDIPSIENWAQLTYSGSFWIRTVASCDDTYICK